MASHFPNVDHLAQLAVALSGRGNGLESALLERGPGTSRVDRDFYSCSKHYGAWYFKVPIGLPDAVTAAQAGWSEKSVEKMVETTRTPRSERWT